VRAENEIDPQSSRFPSKRDRWLEWVVWPGTLLSFTGGLVSAFAIPAPHIAVLTSTISFGAPALMLWTFYGTSYTLLTDELRICSGPLRFHVPLGEITSVTPSRNPRSSPACSLDRLEIQYGQRSRILVSPVDKAAFLQALLRRCDQLVLHQDGLVLRGLL
jgi:hypothetical protein